MILENAGAGTGRHVLDLTRGLLARGWQVHLLYSRDRLEESFARELEALQGVVSGHIELERAPGSKDIRAVREVRRYIAEQGPFTVAHGHSSKGGAIVRLACLGGHTPAFYTPHAFYTLDPTLSGPRALAFRAIEFVLARLGAGVLCVSEAERLHARKLGIPDTRLHVVPNGLGPLPEPERAAVRKEMGLPDDAFAIGYVGRLAPQKRLELLLSAFALTLDHAPHARLVIVGSGPDRGALEALADQLGIADRVLFYGQGDGVRLMSGFDLFAIPSRYEGFSYSMLEAAGRALPIVMTRVGGAEEMTEHAGALICDEPTAAAFSELLLRVIDSPDTADDMRRKALQGGRRFSVDRMVDQIEGIYLAHATTSTRTN